MTESRVEYRAVYRVPWSILDPEELREIGYVEKRTNYGVDKALIRQDNWDLRRSEESWAVVIGWEKRVISVGEWMPDDDEIEVQ